MSRKEESASRRDLQVFIDYGIAQPKKRSLTIAGHRTSITIEDAFWRELKSVAAEMDVSVTALVSAIDSARASASLSAAIRVFLLLRGQHEATESSAKF